MILEKKKNHDKKKKEGQAQYLNARASLEQMTNQIATLSNIKQCSK